MYTVVETFFRDIVVTILCTTSGVTQAGTVAKRFARRRGCTR
jgi:hypothetical protein